MLRTETNTQKVERSVLASAKVTLGNSRHLIAFFEHGQWWIENLRTGAQWSACDAESAGRKYFDFEQVTQGDES